MLRVTLANPAQKRTLRPQYAQHQATPWTGFLDPEWDFAFPIYPGTVMTRLTKEIFRPFTGQTGEVPFGLSAFFVAPSVGINEVTDTATNLYTVWVGDGQALFEILAPAFAPSPVGGWSLADDGSRQMLTADSQGRLTPAGVNNGIAIAELIDIPTPDKITVRMNRFDLATTVAVAGGS